MEAENLEVRIWDATVPDESMKEKADVVLADPPAPGWELSAENRISNTG